MFGGSSIAGSKDLDLFGSKDLDLFSSSHSEPPHLLFVLPLLFRFVPLPSSSFSRPSTREFVEEFLIENLVLLFGSHREEDITADKLVDHLRIR